jgi:hypothetical protein
MSDEIAHIIYKTALNKNKSIINAFTNIVYSSEFNPMTTNIITQ